MCCIDIGNTAEHRILMPQPLKLHTEDHLESSPSPKVSVFTQSLLWKCTQRIILCPVIVTFSPWTILQPKVPLESPPPQSKYLLNAKTLATGDLKRDFAWKNISIVEKRDNDAAWLGWGTGSIFSYWGFSLVKMNNSVRGESIRALALLREDIVNYWRQSCWKRSFDIQRWSEADDFSF